MIWCVWKRVCWLNLGSVKRPGNGYDMVYLPMANNWYHIKCSCFSPKLQVIRHHILQSECIHAQRPKGLSMISDSWNKRALRCTRVTWLQCVSEIYKKNYCHQNTDYRQQRHHTRQRDAQFVQRCLHNCQQLMWQSDSYLQLNGSPNQIIVAVAREVCMPKWDDMHARAVGPTQKYNNWPSSFQFCTHHSERIEVAESGVLSLWVQLQRFCALGRNQIARDTSCVKRCLRRRGSRS